MQGACGPLVLFPAPNDKSLSRRSGFQPDTTKDLSEDNMESLDAWLLFNASGLTPLRQHALLRVFEAPERIFAASDGELAAIEGITAQHVKKLRDAEREINLAAIKQSMLDGGVHVVTWGGEAYPSLLSETDGAPTLLFVQGGLLQTDDQAIAMVGTRKCTPYGRQIARRLAADLARRGFTIVSGMADGIDGEAHESALEAGGRTIAVMASGADITYPRSHRQLRADIANSGAVVTEYAFGTEPLKERFPARNRIISGLARGVIVVEAPMMSGALITARHAAEQGRDVFAVPGNADSPNSRGCHALIKDGAKLVEVAEDVVEGLGIMLEAVPVRAPSPQQQADLTGDEAAVIKTLSFEPRQVDGIAGEAQLPVATVNATLMMLEMKGIVRRFPGNTYVRIS